MFSIRARKALTLVLTTSIGVSTIGCSAFQPKQMPVTITASDSSATLYVDNNPVGTGHTTLNLDRNRSYAVSATVGGRTGTAAIGRKISGTGVLDIVGGVIFLVPFVGCFTPGFWDLDPTTVNVVVPR